MSIETLQRYVPLSEQIALIVRWMMVNEFGLMPPSKYDLARKKERVYLVGTFDPYQLHKKLSAYESEDVLRRLSNALNGLPVVCTKNAGLHYGFILSGRPDLPKMIPFPEIGMKDVFRFGMGMDGEVRIHANVIQNIIIGASQGAGKSNLLTLIAHQARAFGWRLYLSDPQSHTFNPDVWNEISAAPVAGSQDDFIKILDRLEGEMAERVAAFRKMAQGGIPPVDIDAYNEISDSPMKRIVFIVDEANTVLEDKSIEKRLSDLARQGRKWGLHIVLAGHNWRANDVPRRLSAMLQTRIALRVADSTSGKTVLDHDRWGKWVMGKPPGRGVLRSGKYIPMQFYRVSPEQEHQWLEAVETPSPLNLLEQAMVSFAVVDRDGEFKVSTIVEAVEGATEYIVRKTAKSWEERGWLETGKDAVSARRVSSKLAGFAHISLAGTQGSQGNAGALEGSQGLSQGSQANFNIK